MTGYDLILGYPWLAKVNPDVNWSKREWFYRRTSAPWQNIEIVSPEDCVSEVLQGKAAYTVDFRILEDSLMMNAVQQGNEIPAVYQDYADIFSEEKAGILARHQMYDHTIELVDNSKVLHRPIYPLSESELAVLREYLEMALQKGWIRPSKSPAGAPILFVPKKDGGLRLCVDYRGLNALTIKNHYPLPLVGETMDYLTNIIIYSKFDLRDAYHRIRIHKGDEWKTAFRTRYGHFEYRVMPFGLVNIPTTF
jgi:hypothetical protein